MNFIYMSIVNFSITQPLEKKVQKAIKEHGFTSKAEFFRFAALYFVHQLNHPYLSDDEEYRLIMQRLAQTAHEVYGDKQLTSLKEQFADLR